MKLDNSLKFTFLIGLVVVFLVALGFLPRIAVIPLTILFSLFVLSKSLEDSVILFTAFIPFFIAIPITDVFDSFNMWRIVAGLIFLKWFFTKRPRLELKSVLPVLLVLLLLIAVISIGVSHDKFIAIKRVIYFINLSFVPVVAADLIGRNRKMVRPLLQAMIVPAFIVMFIGFNQLISTYITDAGSFHSFWAEQIQFSFYGSEWSNIALNQGNTWFAYYGNQLTLRMFSVFPDSHSFPIFLLLAIPAMYALRFNKKVLAIVLLAVILSGTRGVWLAMVAPVFVSLFFFRRIKLAPHFLIFILLFGVAYPLFASPQFNIDNSDLLRARLRSIIDFAETSNSGRIHIWKESLKSVVKNPIIGVGIGNFPIVLDEDINYIRAGSSAHNIYLNVAVELGIVALIFFLYSLYLIFRKIYVLMDNKDELINRYSVAAFMYFIWVFTYFMTDVTLFDERIFLLFGMNLAIIYALEN
ncbi:MAG: O-antigen ligase family protein, partial [Nitrososphaeraceae archaeon]|nr:O-antigen ligase family protein [Nitrososphaeraceae archaeon]